MKKQVSRRKKRVMKYTVSKTESISTKSVDGRKGGRKTLNSIIRASRRGSIQKYYTSLPLCREMIEKLNEKNEHGYEGYELVLFNHSTGLYDKTLNQKTEEKTLQNSNILVMFNTELVYVLINEYKINPKNITFLSDSKERIGIAKKMGANVVYKKNIKERVKNGENILERSFDFCLANPPYDRGLDLNFLEMCIKKLELNNIVFIHPSTYLIDQKNIESIHKRIKRLLYGKLKSARLFNGNFLFKNVKLFVPCVLINYDSNYNGKCQVDYFGNKYETDVWNITKFREEWEIIVKPFMEKMKVVCKKWNDIGSNSLKKTSKINKKLSYCQLAAIRGNVDTPDNERFINNDIVQEDFYTMVMIDSNENKGIRIEMNKPGGVIPTFEFKTKVKRDNFIEYCKTYFARFCLAIYKNGQHLDNKELSLIPWLDFTQKWDDEKLFLHFGIDEKTQKYIRKFLPDYYGIK